MRIKGDISLAIDDPDRQMVALGGFFQDEQHLIQIGFQTWQLDDLFGNVGIQF